jgi:hypothetical protein
VKATKQTRQPRPIVQYPSILVLNEKHARCYWRVDNDAMLFAVALKVLTERLKSGHWYYAPLKEDKPKPLDFSHASLASMPESLRVEARRKLQFHESSMRRWTQEHEAHARILKAVDDKDGRAAWEALCSMRAGEYEGFDLKPLETP